MQRQRLLIDTGATKSILYFKCFEEMEMSDNHLKPSNMVLEGFMTHKIVVKRIFKIKVTLGADERTRTEEIKFYLVDIDSPYNAILRTPAHAGFNLIVSMSQQQVKFTTGNGVGFFRSSPKNLLGYMMR